MKPNAQRLLGTLAAVMVLSGWAPARPADSAPLLAISPSVVPLAGWRVPLAGSPVVLRSFFPPPPDQPWLPGHRGVDLAASAGSAIMASAAGVVSFAGPLAGRSVVVVRHGEFRSTYEPVAPVVRAGQLVSAGQLIGHLEPVSTHCGRPCLHWGLLRGDVYRDPLPGRVFIRLLPFTSGAGSRPTQASQDSERVRGVRSPGRSAPEPESGASWFAGLATAATGLVALLGELSSQLQDGLGVHLADP